MRATFGVVPESELKLAELKPSSCLLLRVDKWMHVAAAVSKERLRSDQDQGAGPMQSSHLRAAVARPTQLFSDDCLSPPGQSEPLLLLALQNTAMMTAAINAALCRLPSASMMNAEMSTAMTAAMMLLLISYAAMSICLLRNAAMLNTAMHAAARRQWRRAPSSACRRQSTIMRQQSSGSNQGLLAGTWSRQIRIMSGWSPKPRADGSDASLFAPPKILKSNTQRGHPRRSDIILVSDRLF